MERWVFRPVRWQTICDNSRYLLQKKKLHWHCLRPAPLLALAAAAGVFASDAWPEIVVPMTGVLFFTFVCRRLKIRPVWLPVLIPMIFSVAALHTMLIVKPARAHADQFAGKTIQLQGTVLSMPDLSDQSGPIVIRQTNGVKIMLYLQPDAPAVSYGDRITAQVSCRLPDTQRNPGGFSEKAWLKSQGIYLAAHPVAVEQLTIISRDNHFSIVKFSASLRAAFSRMMGRLLQPRQAALLAGLLIGDTRQIDDEVKSDFKLASLSHLLSVSGANVSYLLLPAGRLLKKLRFGRQIRMFALIVLLIGFGFLTAWQISVTRAILMSGFVMAGRLLHRPSDAISLLSTAALALLLFKPLSALNLGFWLSVAATASLILFTGPISQKIRHFCRVPELLADAIAATASIQMIILPLLVSAGSTVSLAGLSANIPAGPLNVMITWLSALVLPLPAVMEMAIGSDIPLNVLQQIGRPLGFLIDLLSWLAQLTARVQFGRLPVGMINPAFWPVWFISFVFCLIRLGMIHPCSGHFSSIVSFLYKPALAVWLGCMIIQASCAPLCQVWFFDVGQGDAILIIGRRGESMLIDGGKPGSGVNDLMPALDALGVQKIDLAILTHGHDDHAGGLIDLLKAGRISQLAVSAEEAEWARADWNERLGHHQQQNNSDLTHTVIETAKSAQITVSEISGNDTIVLGQQIRLKVLNDRQAIDQQPSDVNEFSLLMLGELAGCRILLTADCPEDIENRLSAEEKWPEADLLKVAHHGSRFATSESFLRQVEPIAAMISVGPNVYGHPAPATLSRLMAAGCQVYRTDQSGAICLKIYDNHWQMIRYCP